MTADNVITGKDFLIVTPANAPKEAPIKNKTNSQPIIGSETFAIGNFNVKAIKIIAKTVVTVVNNKAVVAFAIKSGLNPLGDKETSLLVRSSHSLVSKVPVLTIPE